MNHIKYMQSAVIINYGDEHVSCAVMVATHGYRRNNPNAYDYVNSVHMCERFEIGEIKHDDTVVITCYDRTTMNKIEVVRVVRVENVTKLELMSFYTLRSKEKKK